MNFIRNKSRKHAFTLAEVFLPHFAKSHKHAFTLAEVLITLGIIGVVSVIVIPSLVSKSRKDVYVIQMKQMYSMLSQAVTQQKNDRQALNLRESGLRTLADVETFTKKHFRVMKECGATKTPCFASSYSKLNGTSISTWNPTLHYTLSGGQSLGLSVDNVTCAAPSLVFRYYIDVNGPKAPNVLGRDLAVFYVYNEGVVDDTLCANTTSVPLTVANRNTAWNNNCSPSAEGAGVTGCLGYWLNNNWNMDY